MTRAKAIEDKQARRDEQARIVAVSETNLETRSAGRDTTQEAVRLARDQLAEFDRELDQLKSATPI